MPGLQSGFFTGQAVPSKASVAPTPGLVGTPTPPASVPGLTGFAPPSAPSQGSVSGSATGSVPHGSDTTARKKSRLDGTMDPSDLDAEIARYEKELAEPKPSAPAPVQESGRIVTTPNVNPNVDGGDPLASAFLTPEELSRLQGSDSFPTRRMPLGPGQQ